MSLHALQPHFKMAEHLIGLIQDLQSNCEIYDSNFDPIKKRHKKSSYSYVNQALDALADVLVSDKSDVFAIAARMTRDKLILTISTNTSAKLKAIDHLNCIWGHLNAVGNEYAGLQQQQKRPLALDDDAMTTTSLELPKHDISKAKRMIAEDFRRYMYEYSSQELLQRLEEARLGSLELLRDKSLTENLRELLDRIIHLLKRVFEVLDASPNELPEGEDLGKFCLGLDAIDTFVRKLFDDDGCVKEVDLLDALFRTQAARCLKKVTSITRSINILLTYANNPYLRSRFLRGKRLEIECVPDHQYNLKLPPTPEDYKSIARLALITQGSYWNSEGKPGDHIMQHYHINLNSAPVLPAPVHCECALVSYLLKEDISPPPFSYIGTSELSCFPCWKFLECLRKGLGINYHIRGTHNKSHWPWKYPETIGALLPHQTKKVQDSFYVEIARRYTECILRCRQEEEWEAERASFPSMEELDKLWAET